MPAIVAIFTAWLILEWAGEWESRTAIGEAWFTMLVHVFDAGQAACCSCEAFADELIWHNLLMQIFPYTFHGCGPSTSVLFFFANERS